MNLTPNDRVEHRVRFNFRKGDKAILLKVGASRGVAYCNAYPIQITSWGKKQGTAIRLDLGRNALERLSNSVWCFVFPDIESARRFGDDYAVAYAAHSLARELLCEESNLPNVHPQYRPEVRARIDALKAAVPSLQWRIAPEAK
jgi:hypothetical protein